MESRIPSVLKNLSDEEVYSEAARRVKDLIEGTVGEKFTYGVIEFVFHAGHFVRIDCKPSLRAYVHQEKTLNASSGGRRER